MSLNNCFNSIVQRPRGFHAFMHKLSHGARADNANHNNRRFHDTFPTSNGNFVKSNVMRFVALNILWLPEDYGTLHKTSFKQQIRLLHPKRAFSVPSSDRVLIVFLSSSPDCFRCEWLVRRLRSTQPTLQNLLCTFVHFCISTNSKTDIM